RMKTPKYTLTRSYSIVHGLILVINVLFTPFSASGQPSADDVNPVLVRRAWLFGEELEEIMPRAAEARAAPYVLTQADRERFKGSFGINFSHYDFDIDPGNPDCKTQEGYVLPKCSCTINWQGLVDSGLIYTYAKATDGASADLAFARYWS